MKSVHKAPVTTCFIFLSCILEFRKVLAVLAQHSSCRMDKPQRISLHRTPFKQIICSHSRASLTLEDSQNCQDFVVLCPCRCFPKEAVVCQYLRDRVGYGSVSPRQKLLNAECVPQGHSLLRRECGFALCSSVRRERMCGSAFFYCSNSQNYKFSSLKEKEPG